MFFYLGVTPLLLCWSFGASIKRQRGRAVTTIFLGFGASRASASVSHQKGFSLASLTRSFKIQSNNIDFVFLICINYKLKIHIKMWLRFLVEVSDTFAKVSKSIFLFSFSLTKKKQKVKAIRWLPFAPQQLRRMAVRSELPKSAAQLPTYAIV